MLRDKLQVYLVTYNRKNKLIYTLNELLKSPVRDFDITVLDNASTDGSSEIIDEYCAKFPNIKHIRHNVNIGGNANICRAFELSASCGKDYAWILCDDDKYDFSNWAQVEDYINKDKDIICVSDYIYPTQNDKNNKAYQIFQLTFVPASIFKIKNITDGVMINMYDSIYTMFQQSCLTINIINRGGEIAVLDKPIVHNGLHFKDKEDAQSLAYTRGSEEKEILARRKDTVWILGFCNVVTLLKDKELQKECIEVSIPYKDIYNSWNNFYTNLCLIYLKFDKLNYFYEIYSKLYFKRQIDFIKYLCIPLLKNFAKQIFSIRNSCDRKHKIITIFGVKFSIKRKQKENKLENET